MVRTLAMGNDYFSEAMSVYRERFGISVNWNTNQVQRTSHTHLKVRKLCTRCIQHDSKRPLETSPKKTGPSGQTAFLWNNGSEECKSVYCKAFCNSTRADADADSDKCCSLHRPASSAHLNIHRDVSIRKGVPPALPPPPPATTSAAVL
ncbi:hypothetical protein EVAR_39732_1 [Eumeta japonica]|uniref:Uncharacterized protein n=1 Tax=Eumeta variegata TaxID=151549 RepID=A0A4C1W5R1_EUMVA|nr:hypothetical protein EVAR_39732_1 [Eumeta japonica]